jgi:hypothetical protein
MDTAWQVIRPDGSQWAAFGSPWSSANSLIDTTTLTQTGTYVIKVDPNGTATGSLTFKAWTVPADLDAGTLQVDSATGVKVTTVPGQNATLSFHGTSGQRVQLQASGATMDAGWAVYRPDGSQWASFGSPWSSVNSLIDTTTLTQTGTYVINIDPRGTASGSITFKAWTVPADLDLPLTLDGTAVTAAIASPGQNATLRFQASAGQRIQVQGSGATMDAAWSLTNPDGSAIASFGPPWTSTNSTVGATTLTQTGTYTVTLDPAGTTTGSVTFKAWALLPDLDLGALPTDGSTTNASNASGQNLTASFTGTQGKSVVVTLANQAGGTVDWKVLDPDGQQVFSATGNTSWYGTLAKTGTYVLKLNPRAPDRTTFTLGVSVTDAPPQLADRLNSGQKLTAGQQLTSPNGGYSLRMQTDGNLVVYGSNNNAIWDSRTWNNPGAYAILQPDGNLVVYRSNNSAAWATGTNGQPVDRAVIQDDGSLVLYTASGSRVWSSR